MLVLWIILIAIIAVLVYVRLAPSDPARWHVQPAFSQDRNMPGGVVRIVETGPDGLARLDPIARAEPRTTVLAGSVAEGMITYVSRSQVIGFPDYTTVWQDGNRLVIHGRLRFGRSDFGVNRARVEAWIRALQTR